MAITLSHLTADGANGANVTAFATAPVTPAPDGLVLASIVTYENTATSVPDPTVTGLGLSWTLVGKVPQDDTGGDRGSTWIFAGTGTPATGAVTFTFPVAVYSANWIVDQAVGAGSVPQAVTAVGNGVTTLAATLAAFSDPSSVGYAVAGVQATATTFAPGTGWTALGDAQVGGYCLALSETGPDVDASASFTGSTVYKSGLIALELAPAAAARPSGAATGAFTVTGAASGIAGHSGVAQGSFAFSGTATGTAPAVGTASGTATGTHAWTGQATGTTRKSGAATGTHTWTGTAHGASSTPGRDLTITGIGGPASPVSTTGPARRPINAPEPVLTATAAEPGLRSATTEPSL